MLEEIRATVSSLTAETSIFISDILFYIEDFVLLNTSCFIRKCFMPKVKFATLHGNKALGT